MSLKLLCNNSDRPYCSVEVAVSLANELFHVCYST